MEHRREPSIGSSWHPMDDATDLQLQQLHDSLEQDHRALLAQLSQVRMETARAATQYNVDDVLRLRETYRRLQRADLDTQDRNVIVKETESKMEAMLDAERHRADQLKIALQRIGEECAMMRGAIEKAKGSTDG
ncbi:Hypothetical protein, putative [Bodo saltans]|uniref:Uncharacterized protein n=1 Tax=Bodo saltans TaxID=75058 RepID=A0A0S4JIK2_BODSA|nr:Hypothetical protein, putative [Bodo saltans]|eukprot:CUG89997.1 Hypothetical protein, putative [Bodo saltans]